MKQLIILWILSFIVLLYGYEEGELTLDASSTSISNSHEQANELEKPSSLNEVEYVVVNVDPAKSDTSKTKRSQNYRKNAVLFHPIALSRIPFETYLVEMDYLRILPQDFAVLIRPLFKDFRRENIYTEFIPNGNHREIALEIGIRKNFYFVQRSNSRWGIYPQWSFSTGHFKPYDIDQYDWEPLEPPEEGFILKGMLGLGSVSEYGRIVLHIDIQVGGAFISPGRIETFAINPNLAVGFLF